MSIAYPPAARSREKFDVYFSDEWHLPAVALPRLQVTRVSTSTLILAPTRAR